LSGGAAQAASSRFQFILSGRKADFLLITVKEVVLKRLENVPGDKKEVT